MSESSNGQEREFEVLPPESPASPSAASSGQPASQLSLLGLHPVLVGIILLCDWGLTALELSPSVTISYLTFSIPAALILGFITQLVQKLVQKDSFGIATLKGIVVAILTGIPFPLATTLPLLAAWGLLTYLQSQKNK